MSKFKRELEITLATMSPLERFYRAAQVSAIIIGLTITVFVQFGMI